MTFFIGAKCSECEKTITCDYISKTKMKYFIRAAHWSIGKECLCPECKIKYRRKQK